MSHVCVFFDTVKYFQVDTLTDIVDEEKARGGAVEFIDVFETLATRSATIPWLPPGGGVYAK